MNNQKNLGQSLLFVFELLMLIDRRDQTMTALLTGVVVVLVVCHFPKAIMNVYECYQVINIIGRLLICSSIYFIFKFLMLLTRMMVLSMKDYDNLIIQQLES